MKNFSRFSILAAVLLALAGSAAAFDLPVNATVSIVEGVSAVEDVQLNFGVLALSDGAVTINPETDAITNGDNIIFDDTAIVAGEFTVTSCDGIVVALEIAETGPVAGLALSAFTASWDGGAVEDADTGDGSDHTMAAATAALKVGATLTVTSATAAIADDQEIEYTLTLTLP